MHPKDIVYWDVKPDDVLVELVWDELSAFKLVDDNTVYRQRRRQASRRGHIPRMHDDVRIARNTAAAGGAIAATISSFFVEATNQSLSGDSLAPVAAAIQDERSWT